MNQLTVNEVSHPQLVLPCAVLLYDQPRAKSQFLVGHADQGVDLVAQLRTS